MSDKPDLPVAINDFYKVNAPSANYALCFDDVPSLTRQEFADECDINNIMRSYERTGVINWFSQRPPAFVDFTSVPTSLMEFMSQMHDAENAFMQLPADVRKMMDNDPVKFVDYAADPKNIDQMRAWGLAPQPVQEPPVVPDSSVSAPASPAAKAVGEAPKPPAGASSTVGT